MILVSSDFRLNLAIWSVHQNCLEYTGLIKKGGISGILADFGNYFFQPVMATNIIENLTIFWIFLTSLGG